MSFNLARWHSILAAPAQDDLVIGGVAKKLVELFHCSISFACSVSIHRMSMGIDGQSLGSLM